MHGIDSAGYDMRADERILRFDFAEAVLDAQQARQALVKMSALAR
jgi:putative heme iron utilization protein